MPREWPIARPAASHSIASWRGLPSLRPRPWRGRRRRGTPAPCVGPPKDDGGGEKPPPRHGTPSGAPAGQGTRARAADHAAGNYRVMTNLASELLSVAMDRDLPKLDEKLYLEVFQQTARAKPASKKK